MLVVAVVAVVVVIVFDCFCGQFSCHYHYPYYFYFYFPEVGTCFCVLYDIDLYSRLMNPAVHSHTALRQESKLSRSVYPSTTVTFELTLDYRDIETLYAMS